MQYHPEMTGRTIETQTTAMLRKVASGQGRLNKIQSRHLANELSYRRSLRDARHSDRVRPMQKMPLGQRYQFRLHAASWTNDSFFSNW
jgi:hypothetical protein